MTEEQINDLSINDDDVVDPWNVAGKSQTGIDYDKLISKFMISPILCFSLMSLLFYIKLMKVSVLSCH